ncbi:MAG: class I SAM-dependent methyltransferase, partial [Candidatus Goldbacteria bacterium]|nr:class I SAM-dependent methyltransferase [Candidatus Goldiibacteriota bacterium]
GRGDFYKEIKELVKNYTGIEPSKKMLGDEIIQDDFKLMHGNGEDFDEKESYDVCLLKEVLDHCYDPNKVIKNCYDALKPDGIIIITLSNKNAYYKLIFKKMAEKLKEEHKDHLHNFSPKEVIDMMKNCGFIIEENISMNYLKLPIFLEKFLNKFPFKFIIKLNDLFDGIGKVLLKDKGGSFILIGRKEPKSEEI